MQQQVDKLTPRERQFLELASYGLTNAQIGRRTHVEPTTVNTTLRNAYRRLGACGRAQAVALYVAGQHARGVSPELWERALEALRDAECAVPLHSSVRHRLAALLHEISTTVDKAST